MTCWSARPPSRASDMMATRLPISGASPKFVPRPASVGAAQLCDPEQASSTRAMVPLPLRFGPISANAFCWRVSAVRQ